jgi:uncharacterized protein
MRRKSCACLVGVLIFISSLILEASVSADAASFDCKTHQKPDEVAICNDSTLPSLDRELAAIYGRLRASFTPEQASALRETQLNFLRSRRACGSDRACLTALYRDRIAVLNAPSTPNAVVRTTPPLHDSRSPQSSVTPQQGAPPEAQVSAALDFVRSATCNPPSR